jgi:SAM-dependent methyltransferase
MGLYRVVEAKVRGARDYARLDPVKHSLVRVLTEAAARCPRGRWLDLGAGSGVHREIFGPWALEYVAVDPAPRGGGVVPAVGEALPFRDGSFDTVVISEVLEHVREPAAVLGEALRVVRPGGALLVTVPFVFYEHEAPNDFRRYTRGGLTSELVRAGFDVEDSGPVCGLLATLKIFGCMLLLGSVGQLPGMWEPTLVLNDFLIRAVVLPLDRRLDPGKRWAQGHWALARRRDPR